MRVNREFQAEASAMYKSRTGKRLYIREKAASIFLDVLLLFLDQKMGWEGGGGAEAACLRAL